MSLRIGIDLGGTNIAVGLVDESYRILHRVSVPTLADRPYMAVIRDMGKASLRLLEEAGVPLETVEQVGIGCPGTPVKETGEVLFSNNLHWHNVPLFQELKQILPLPLRIDNDANAAALGETLAGSAKGAQAAVMVTLGTGVGGGIILNGKVYDGINHAGAEVGHTVIVSGGELCTCGRRGCWEAYASATALIRIGEAKADRLAKSRLATLKMLDGKLSGKTIFESFHEGDYAAQEVVEEYLFYVAEGITNLVNIFQPEVVVIGGGISAQEETILEPIRQHVARDVFCKQVSVPRIVTAALGNDAGIIGAAFL